MPTLEQLDAAMARAWRHVPVVQQLGGGDITFTDPVHPLRVTGTDAAVYQLRQRDGTLVALRCPLSDTFNSTHAVQYQAIERNSDLERDWLARSVTYHSEGVMLPRRGLRSEGKSVIAMEWIEGLMLLEAVEQACRIGHHSVLMELAQEWLSVAAEMKAIGFVHGDLSAENILVGSNGRIQLVDYDTSTWPGSPPVSPALGTPGFVHPRANLHTRVAHRDAFSALVIYVSLHALAVRPEIWNRARTQRGRSGQELLFSAWDLAHSGSSPIFAELHHTADQQVQAAVFTLAAACDGAPDTIPPLGMVADVANLDSPRAIGGVAIRDRTSLRDRRVARLDKGLVAGADRSPGGPAAPSSGKREDRAELIRRLQRAVMQEDGETIARVWPEVRGDRRVSAVAILAADILQRRFGKAIADALRVGDDRAIVSAVKEAERSGVAVTASTRRAARMGTRRIKLRERLAAAMSGNDRKALVEIALSAEIEELHPLDGQTSSAIGHALAASQLDWALRTGDDTEIAAIVRSDERLDTSRFDDAMRARVDLAMQRVRWVERVRSALRERDGRALEVAFQEDPGGARDPLGKGERSRAERMIERERATRRLNRAMADGSDEAVVAAINQVMASGAPLPTSAEWEKVRKAVEHILLIEALQEAAHTSPPDHVRLARLLPAARVLEREAPSLVTELDLDGLEETVLREAHRARLHDALAAGDDDAIAEAAYPDAFGTLASLDVELRRKVEQAVAAVRWR
jgi:hypothetical protein